MDYETKLKELKEERNRLVPDSTVTAEMSVEEVVEVQTRLAAINRLLPLVEKKCRTFSTNTLMASVYGGARKSHLSEEQEKQLKARKIQLEKMLAGEVHIPYTSQQLRLLTDGGAGPRLGAEFVAENRKAVEAELEQVCAQLNPPEVEDESNENN